MIQMLSKPLTLEEFLQLPETKPPGEYIEGEIKQKPMPPGKHSIIQAELVTAINSRLKPKAIGRAFPELRCTFGGRSTVPDISVFCRSRIPRDENGEISNIFTLAPDWTIEILSPDQSQTRVTKNILHCLNYSTQMGWLIDGEDQTVLVYFPQQQIQIFDRSSAKLPVPSFAEELQLTVGDLFAWLLV